MVTTFGHHIRFTDATDINFRAIRELSGAPNLMLDLPIHTGTVLDSVPYYPDDPMEVTALNRYAERFMVPGMINFVIDDINYVVCNPVFDYSDLENHFCIVIFNAQLTHPSNHADIGRIVIDGENSYVYFRQAFSQHLYWRNVFDNFRDVITAAKKELFDDDDDDDDDIFHHIYG